MAWPGHTMQLPWPGLSKANPGCGGGATHGHCSSITASPHALAEPGWAVKQCTEPSTPHSMGVGGGARGRVPHWGWTAWQSPIPCPAMVRGDMEGEEPPHTHSTEQGPPPCPTVVGGEERGRKSPPPGARKPCRVLGVGMGSRRGGGEENPPSTPWKGEEREEPCPCTEQTPSMALLR